MLPSVYSEESVTRITIEILEYCHAGEPSPFFKNFRLEISGGGIVCILGSTGTGKTSLIRALLGYAAGTLKGKIKYVDGGASYSPQTARESGKIALFSEDAGLVPWLTIQKNVELPASLNAKLHMPERRDILNLLQSARLNIDTLNKLPHELSFGMAQRVRLVRSLAYKPRFFLLDETYNGLDPITAKQIATMVGNYVAESGACCIMITHDLLLTTQFASRTIFMDKGRNLIEIPRPFTIEVLMQHLINNC